MVKKTTPIEGVYILPFFKAADNRGFFAKPFSAEQFEKWGLETQWTECFYSMSKPKVLRGMHDQKAPHAMTKCIWVTSGSILDVILDLRKDSATFGKTFSVALDSDTPKAVYIPEGCSHGFTVTSDTDAQVFYLQSGPYAPQSERGVLWNSFGFQWPSTNPIISERDNAFPPFNALEL